MGGFFDNINLSAKREHDESYEEYRDRMKKNNKRLKMHYKGEQIWDSKTQGTFVRKRKQINN